MNSQANVVEMGTKYQPARLDTNPLRAENRELYVEYYGLCNSPNLDAAMAVRVGSFRASQRVYKKETTVYYYDDQSSCMHSETLESEEEAYLFLENLRLRTAIDFAKQSMK